MARSRTKSRKHLEVSTPMLGSGTGSAGRRTGRGSQRSNDGRRRPVMRREVKIAVAGLAVVAGGLSGCSGSQPSATTGATPAVASSSGAGPGAGAAKVVVDGQDQHVQGSVRCETGRGFVTIAIGEAPTGVVAAVTDANPPEAKSVSIANGNGMPLVSGSGQGQAQVTKDGNSYTITGTAASWDPANPGRMTRKPFRIDVTCP